MTTDDIYATEYLSMPSPDGSRSIAKLLEEETYKGYAEMTDAEIAKLIAYKEYRAKAEALSEIDAVNQAELVELEMASSKEALEQASKAFEEQIAISREIANALKGE